MHEELFLLFFCGFIGTVSKATAQDIANPCRRAPAAVPQQHVCRAMS